MEVRDPAARPYNSLDSQALVGHDVEGRVLGGRCVLCSPDEAVGAVEDRVTSVGEERAQREVSSEWGGVGNEAFGGWGFTLRVGSLLGR